MRIICFYMILFLSFSVVSGQNLNKAQALSKTLEQRMAAERAAAVELATKQGFPVKTITPEGVIVELQAIDHGRPLYYTTHNAKAAETISTDKIHKQGVLGYALSGSGYSLGMWEGGTALTAHNEFGGRVSLGDDGSQITLHATHTAGTLIAAGLRQKARGMAFEANLHSFDWNADLAEMAAKAGDGMTLSNHSYGPQAGWFYNLFNDKMWVWYGDTTLSAEEDYQFGYYLDRARQWDDLIHQIPHYLIVTSAGNNRSDLGPDPGSKYWIFDGTSWYKSLADRQNDGGADGYDSISGFALAKNILTIGAVKPFQGSSRTPADIYMTRFSGWGPTDDGRIKPDVVADGLSVYSTSNESINAYAVRNGTSSSTPSVTGSVVLLKEHYHSLFGDAAIPAALLKALVMHTADEAGENPGPDYKFGWGLMNSSRAVDLISMDHAAGGNLFIQKHTLESGQSIEFQVQASGDTPLKATLCWTDPVGEAMEPALNNRQRILVNDLDLRIIGPDNREYMPWVLDPDNPSQAASSGDNIRDNVEQVFIAAPEPGLYTVHISHKQDLQGDEQRAALVLSGTICSDMEAPSAPSLENPADHTTLETGNTTLEWQGAKDAVSYMLQVAQDSDFNELFMEEIGIRNLFYPLSRLVQNQTFYWRLFAVNPAGNGQPSQTWQFSTDENALTVIWEKITPPELDFFVRDIIVNKSGHIFASLLPPANLSSNEYRKLKGTYRSKDRGKTWENINNETRAYAIDSKGVLYSIGSGDINRMGSNGEEDVEVYRNWDFNCRDFYIDENDGFWAVLKNGLVIYSSDNGVEWQEMGQITLQQYVEIQSMSWLEEKLFVATWGDGVYCSSDSGRTWSSLAPNSCPDYVYTIEEDLNGKYWLGAVNGLFYASTENPSFQRVDHEVLRKAKITTILVKDCGVIYVGNYGCSQAGIGVFVSLDHGNNWMSVSAGLNHLSARVIYESPQGELFTGIGSSSSIEGGAIYRGMHDKAMQYIAWEYGATAPGTSLLQSPANSSLQHPQNLVLRWQAVEHAGCYQVEISPDAGFAEIVFEAQVEGVHLTPTGLDDYSQYFWRVRAMNALGPGPWSEIRNFNTDPTVSVSETEKNIPDSFALYANYPNPFNPRTTLSFDVAQKSFVQIKVYNINGRCVETLFSREVAPGPYEAVWNAQNLGSGMYFVTMQAGSFKALQKCLLLK